MKMNKLVLMGLTAAAVLSSCGRNDYNGTYSGTATNGANGATTNGIANNQFNNFATQDTVTLTLNQNGEQVQGSYTSASGETGNFYANARSSNRLDSVQLNIQQYSGNNTTGNSGFQTMPTGYGAFCAGAFYTGSLNAPDDARQIEGTLNAAGGMVSNNPQCTSKTFRLFKNGRN
jgi:hypothetical protein